jgi:hypothetical protein
MARYVDFNQGIDARLCTEESMALLSELAIRPLRIAFDGWCYREPYETAVRLAAKHGIKHLSNYLLYNYNEKPEELWQRLELNVSLAEELDLQIHSFPMKYCPIWHEDGYHRNRDYLGPHWNRKFVRAVQSVLNATRGKISRRRDFFERAFGKDLDEFRRILHMPENYIILRLRSEELGLTEDWQERFEALSEAELQAVLPIVYAGRFDDGSIGTPDEQGVIPFLAHYRIRYEEIKAGSACSILGTAK